MEYVWYSPELDMINISTKEFGFLFKNDEGQFHLNYFLDFRDEPFRLYEFYLVGEL